MPLQVHTNRLTTEKTFSFPIKHTLYCKTVFVHYMSQCNTTRLCSTGQADGSIKRLPTDQISQGASLKESLARHCIAKQSVDETFQNWDLIDLFV